MTTSKWARNGSREQMLLLKIPAKQGIIAEGEAKKDERHQ
jgi:hypothetical protein